MLRGARWLLRNSFFGVSTGYLGAHFVALVASASGRWHGSWTAVGNAHDVSGGRPEIRRGKSAETAGTTVGRSLPTYLPTYLPVGNREIERERFSAKFTSWVNKVCSKNPERGFLAVANGISCRTWVWILACFVRAARVETQRGHQITCTVHQMS